MSSIDFGRKYALQEVKKHLETLLANGDSETYLSELSERSSLYYDLQDLHNQQLITFLDDLESDKKPVIYAEIALIDALLSQIDDVVKEDSESKARSQDEINAEYQQHLAEVRAERERITRERQQVQIAQERAIKYQRRQAEIQQTVAATRQALENAGVSGDQQTAVAQKIETELTQTSDQPTRLPSTAEAVQRIVTEELHHLGDQAARVAEGVRQVVERLPPVEIHPPQIEIPQSNGRREAEQASQENSSEPAPITLYRERTSTRPSHSRDEIREFLSDAQSAIESVRGTQVQDEKLDSIAMRLDYELNRAGITDAEKKQKVYEILQEEIPGFTENSRQINTTATERIEERITNLVQSEEYSTRLRTVPTDQGRIATGIASGELPRDVEYIVEGPDGKIEEIKREGRDAEPFTRQKVTAVYPKPTQEPSVSDQEISPPPIIINSVPEPANVQQAQSASTPPQGTAPVPSTPPPPPQQAASTASVIPPIVATREIEELSQGIIRSVAPNMPRGERETLVRDLTEALNTRAQNFTPGADRVAELREQAAQTIVQARPELATRVTEQQDTIVQLTTQALPRYDRTQQAIDRESQNLANQVIKTIGADLRPDQRDQLSQDLARNIRTTIVTTPVEENLHDRVTEQIRTTVARAQPVPPPSRAIHDMAEEIVNTVGGQLPQRERDQLRATLARDINTRVQGMAPTSNPLQEIHEQTIETLRQSRPELVKSVQDNQAQIENISDQNLAAHYRAQASAPATLTQRLEQRQSAINTATERHLGEYYTTVFNVETPARTRMPSDRAQRAIIEQQIVNPLTLDNALGDSRSQKAIFASIKETERQSPTFFTKEEEKRIREHDTAVAAIRTEIKKANPDERPQLLQKLDEANENFLRQNKEITEKTLASRATALFDQMERQAQLPQWIATDRTAAQQVREYASQRANLVAQIEKTQKDGKPEETAALRTQLLQSDRTFLTANRNVLDSYIQNTAPSSAQRYFETGAPLVSGQTARGPQGTIAQQMFVESQPKNPSSKEAAAESAVVRATTKTEKEIADTVHAILNKIDPEKTGEKSKQQINKGQRDAIANHVVAEVLPQLANKSNDELQSVLNTTIRASLEAQLNSRSPALYRDNYNTIVEGVRAASVTLAGSSAVKAAATEQMLVPFAERAAREKLNSEKLALNMESLGLQGPTSRVRVIQTDDGATFYLSGAQTLRQLGREQALIDYSETLGGILPTTSKDTTYTLATNMNNLVYGRIQITPVQEKDAKGNLIFDANGEPVWATEQKMINGTLQTVPSMRIHESTGVLDGFRLQRTRAEDWLLQQLPEEEKDKYLKAKTEKRKQYVYSSLVTGLIYQTTQQKEALETNLESAKSRAAELSAVTEKSRDQVLLLRSLKKEIKKTETALRDTQQALHTFKTGEIKVDPKDVEKTRVQILVEDRKRRKAENRIAKLERTENRTPEQEARLLQLKAAIKVHENKLRILADKQKAQSEKKVDIQELLKKTTENSDYFNQMLTLMEEKERKPLDRYNPDWYKLSKAKNPFSSSLSTVRSVLSPSFAEGKLKHFITDTPGKIISAPFRYAGVSGENHMFMLLFAGNSGEVDTKKTIFKGEINKLARKTGVNIELMVNTGILSPSIVNQLSLGDRLKLESLINDKKNFDHYEKLLEKHPRLKRWMDWREKKTSTNKHKINGELKTLLLRGRLDALPGMFVKRSANAIINHSLLTYMPKYFEFDPQKKEILFKPGVVLRKKLDDRVKELRKKFKDAVWSKIKDTALGGLIKGAGAALAKIGIAAIPVIGQVAGVVMAIDAVISSIPIIGDLWNMIKELLKMALMLMFMAFIQLIMFILQFAAAFSIGGGAALASSGSASASVAQTALPNAASSVQLSAPGLSLGMIYPAGIINAIPGMISWGASAISSFSTLLSSAWAVGSSALGWLTSASLASIATYAAVAASSTLMVLSMTETMDIFLVAPDAQTGTATSYVPTNPLRILKTASRSSVNNGEPIVYTIDVTAPACAPTLTITDTLPENLNFVRMMPNTPADPIPADSVIQSISATGPDGQRRIIWTVTLKEGRYTPPCTQISGGGVLRDANYLSLTEIQALIAGSPIADKAETIATMARTYNVNPMLVLAIFQRETQLGRTGPGRLNSDGRRRPIGADYGCNNLGNMRLGSFARNAGAVDDPNACVFGTEARPDRFALFLNYDQSIQATFQLLDSYMQSGLTTLEQIADRYSPAGDCTVSCEDGQQKNTEWKEIVSYSIYNKRFGRTIGTVYNIDQAGSSTNNTFTVTVGFEGTANVAGDKGCIRNQVSGIIGDPQGINLAGSSGATTSVGGEQCGLGSTIAEAADRLVGPAGAGPLTSCKMKLPSGQIVDNPVHIASGVPCRATNDGSGELFYSHHTDFDASPATEENIYAGAPRGGFSWFWCTWTPIKSYQSIGKTGLNGRYGAENQRAAFAARGGYYPIKTAINGASSRLPESPTVKPGDVIFFFTDSASDADHVGIVYSINIDAATGTGNIETRESNAVTKSRVISVQNFIPTDPSAGLQIAGFGFQDNMN